MGIVRTTLLRGAAYAAATLLTMAAALIVVRRLPARDYAAYQTLVKRLGVLVGYAVGLYGVWAYRGAARGDRAMVGAAYLLTTPVAAAAAAAAYLFTRGMGLGQVVALLASLYGVAAAYWTLTRIVLNASMPVYSAAMTLLRRLSYGALVAVLVYWAGMGLVGALWALLASHFLVLAVSARRLLARRLASLRGTRGALASMLRRLYAPLVLQLGQGLQSLDVAAAYAFSTSSLVAGWFAATSLPLLAADLAITTMANLHSYVLRTGDPRRAATAARLALAAAAPAAAVAALYPLHVAYLVNSQYAWAAAAVPPAAAAMLARIAAATASGIAEGSIGGRGEARGLARLYASTELPSSLLYLAATAAGIAAAPGPAAKAAAWSTALATAELARLLLLTRAAPPAARSEIARLPRWTARYGLLGLAAAAAAAPLAPPPSPRFWEEAIRLAAIGSLTAAVYAGLVLLLDPWLRGLALRAAGAAWGLLRGREGR